VSNGSFALSPIRAVFLDSDRWVVELTVNSAAVFTSVRPGEHSVGTMTRKLLFRGNVRFGSKADIGLPAIHVRYSSKSGHGRVLAECQLCAKSGLMHRSKKARSRTEFGVRSPAQGRGGAPSSRRARRPVLDAPLAHQSGGLRAFDLTN
jgi:hypothetical protein